MFSDYVVLTEGEYIIGIFILHKFQLVPKSPFSLILFASEYLPTYKEREALIHVNLQLIDKHWNLIGEVDLLW